MTTPFPGATFTPAPGSEPRNKQEEHDMLIAWAGMSHMSYFDGLYHFPTKTVHPGYTEYHHNQIPFAGSTTECSSLRVYNDHAEMDIRDVPIYGEGARSYSGTIRYTLNSAFYEALNKIEWLVTAPVREEKITQIISQMKRTPVEDLAQLTVGSVLLTHKRGNSEFHGNHEFGANHAVVLGITGYRWVNAYVQCIGFEDLYPGQGYGTCIPGYNGMSGSYTSGNTYRNIDILQKNCPMYLIQEGTGKTWAEYGFESNPYVPRDVLSRAHATKNMVDDYLRGVGMPRNNRRVEQMLGIGY